MTFVNLNPPVQAILEQYICLICNTKFYINKDDQPKGNLKCPFCSDLTKNIRLFNVEIKSLEEYE